MTGRAAPPWWSALALGALLFGVVGCGATCDRTPDEPPVVFSDGNTDVEAGFYETAPWEGPYLDFPKGRTFRLMHGLGAPPRDVDAELAFNQFPDERAPGAGNQVTIEAVTDEYIEIRNDTCSDIYLRVVASFPARPTDGG